MDEFLYVKTDRSIQYSANDRVMLEDNSVTTLNFVIPAMVGGIDSTEFAWWFVYLNAAGDKYSHALELTLDEDADEPQYVATYDIDYGFSGRAGSVKFALEAIDADETGDILHEWHTRTYEIKVTDTLQGNQVEYSETESDVISALLVRVRQLIAQAQAGITGLDAHGITAGYVPTADGQDGWEWAAQSGGGLTEDIKQALLQIAQKVVYVDEHGQDYYDDLYDALYSVVVVNIRLNPNTLSFGVLNSTQQLTAITTPVGGAVTWVSTDPSVVTVSNTGLVTSVGYGSATVTAISGSVSATCSVTVVQAQLTSISAVYTQTGTVYNTDSLDSLKTDLVVAAIWDNGTTSTVASDDYTLSGTLSVGTSTITVTYSEKTATFEVTVTKGIDYTEDALTGATWNEGMGYNTSTGVLTAKSGSYATDKFSVQDLSYSVRDLDTANNTTFYIFVWDENGTYLGRKEYSNARFQWKPEYQIAIEVRNAGTFDPTTMTMLPYDKRATAVNEFEIDLASMASSVVKANGYYELNVTSAMASVGVNSSNYTDTINRQSIIGLINQAVATSSFPFKAPIRIGTFNYGSKMLISIFVEGITVSDANLATLQNYLVENDVKIVYNY